MNTEKKSETPRQVTDLFGNVKTVQQNPAASPEPAQLFSDSKPEPQRASAPAESAPAEQETVIENKVEAGEKHPSVIPEPPAAEETIVTPPAEPRFKAVKDAPHPAEPVIVKGSAPAAGTPEFRQPAPAPEKSAAFTEKPAEKPRFVKAASDSNAKKIPVRGKFLSLDPDDEKLPLGELMKSVRAKTGLSTQDVTQATRIKRGYVEAIEADNYKALPEGVFPVAYVRTLCELYCLDQAGRDAAVKKASLIQKKQEIPDKLCKDINETVQKNEAEEKRVKKIFLTAGIAILVFLAAVIALVLILVLRPRTPAMPPPGGATVRHIRTIAPETLEKLSPQPVPVTHELQVPQNSSSR